MELLKRFLGGYSDNFAAAISLWPVASIFLTLPILAYLYHRDGRLRFVSVVSTYLAVLYLLGLGCFTLYPLPSGSSGPGITYGIPWQFDPLAFVSDFQREGISTIPQIAFNVVLFMPLGFIAGRLLRWGFVRSVVTGLFVSLCIEAAQGTGIFGLYPYAFRTADVNDLMYNTLGAVLGWWAAALLGRVLPPGALAEEGSVTHEPGFVRRCVAFWLDMLLVLLATLVVCGAGAVVLAALAPEESLVRWLDSVWVSTAAFFVVEGVMPWMHAGSTPGGGFVRMSCETVPRTGARRVVFYGVRLVVLAGSWLTLPFSWVVLGLFYAIARNMPYDYL